jgi:Transport and Golgi organisation 2
MCTLSVITNSGGYLLAMNRDERIARGVGEPPKIHQVNGTKAMYPTDGAGGTWIAANEYGITVALLNWNDLAPDGKAAASTRSRGRVIPALIDSRSVSDLGERLGASHFKEMLPFRLIGVSRSEQRIWEWRWDSAHIQSQAHEWETRHWFSSSLSDERAQNFRGAACRDAQFEPDAGSVPWLRRLHASHGNAPGPFSLCVHRADVKTLSYSEVVVTAGHIQVAHSVGSPCTMDQIHCVILRSFMASRPFMMTHREK